MGTEGTHHGGTRRRRALSWLLVAVLTGIFLVFAGAVATRDPVPFDDPVLAWLHQDATPGMTAVARALSAIGEPTTIAPIALLLALLLLIRRRWREAVLFTVEVGGAAALDLGMKRLFARPRPTLYPHLVPETGFSFPSGHAVGDLAFFLALGLLLHRIWPTRWSRLGLAGVLLALLIGASRPYLQVHYPSDILAGWALGAAWVLLAQLVLESGRDNHPPAPWRGPRSP